MPIQLSISVVSALDDLPTRDDLRFFDRAVRDAAEYVRGVWVSAVSGTVLPGMTNPVEDEEYARSLGMPAALRRVAPMTWMVMADYEKAERIELGFGSYDMKPGLLAGPNSRVGKDGRRYNTVPFRFGTPQTSGPNKGQPRPHFPGEQTMPVEVYDVVKQGGAYPASSEGQRTKVPYLFNEAGDPIGGVNFEAFDRGLDEPMQESYTWKTGLYSGMKGFGSPGHRMYMTFRRVSEPATSTRTYRRPDGKIVTIATTKGSDPNSWIHPGQRANPVIQAVRDYSRPHVESFLLGQVAGRN